MDQAQLENLEKKLGSLETEVFKLRSELERAKRGAAALPAVELKQAATPAAASHARSQV